jgi:DNA-binding beta-propeller fold protein YncE
LPEAELHFKESWRVGSFGEKRGQFRYPSDAVGLLAGSLLVADTWNNRLQVIQVDTLTGSSETLDVFDFPDGQEPCGVALLGDERIFVSVFGFGSSAHGVYEFSWSAIDPLQPLVAEKAAKSKKGSSRASTPVSQSKNKLWRVSFFGGAVGTKAGHFAYPCGVAASSLLGCLFVADSGNSRVVALRVGAKVGDPCEWLAATRDAALAGPKDVATDPAGLVYVADTDNARCVVLRFSLETLEFELVAVVAGSDAEVPMAHPTRCAPLVCPRAIRVEPLAWVADLGGAARPPWSCLVTVLDQGPAAHAAHTFHVRCVEEEVAADADSTSDASPARGVTVKATSTQLSTYGGYPGNAAGMLDNPSGSTLVGTSAARDAGRRVAVVDSNNHSIVLLSWEEPAAE